MNYVIKSTATLDGRKTTPEARLELRRRCVIYFRDGVKRAEIARRLALIFHPASELRSPMLN